MEVIYVLVASFLTGAAARLVTHKKAETPAQPQPTLPNMKDPHYANSDSSAQRVMVVSGLEQPMFEIINKLDWKEPEDSTEVRKAIAKKKPGILKKLADLFYRGMCARAGIEPYKDYSKKGNASLSLTPTVIKITAQSIYPAINDKPLTEPEGAYEWQRLLDEMKAHGVLDREDLVMVLNVTKEYAKNQERTSLATYNRQHTHPKDSYFSHVGLVRISMSAFFTFLSFRREREELLKKNRNMYKPVVEPTKPEVTNSKSNDRGAYYLLALTLATQITTILGGVIVTLHSMFRP